MASTKPKKTKKIKTDPFDEIDSSSIDHTLSIGIFTHGRINVDETGAPIVHACPMVRMNKQNVGAYGCLSYGPHSIKDDPANYHEASETLINFDTCFDSKTYIDKYSRPEEFAENDRITMTKPLHKTEGACSVFKDFLDCIEKRYSTDPNYQNLIFLTSNDRVNIVSADLKKLKSFFFKYKKGDKTDVLKLQEFIDDRDREGIEHGEKIITPQIFMLIEMARKYLNIQNVNILDKSCNGILSTGQVVDPNDLCGPYSISCNGRPHNGKAFGGKKRRTRVNK